MQLINVTYPFCKFGFKHAFKQRYKNISEWRSVQNMQSFNANIVTTLWGEKVQTISFTVCMYVYTNICVYVYIYMYVAQIT